VAYKRWNWQARTEQGRIDDQPNWQGNREKPSIPLSLEERVLEESTMMAVFCGPSGGGDHMEITKLRTNGNQLEVHVTKISSHPSCATPAVITCPFSIPEKPKDEWISLHDYSCEPSRVPLPDNGSVTKFAQNRMS
jgi:hypothetical protein